MTRYSSSKSDSGIAGSGIRGLANESKASTFGGAKGSAVRLQFLFLVLTALLMTVSHAAVTTVAGTIALMRDTTLLQPDGRLQGLTLLQLSVPFSNGCNWVWINSADNRAAATALAAKLSGASVTIGYDNTIVSPWGETDICGIVTIDLN